MGISLAEVLLFMVMLVPAAIGGWALVRRNRNAAAVETRADESRTR